MTLPVLEWIVASPGVLITKGWPIRIEPLTATALRLYVRGKCTNDEACPTPEGIAYLKRRACQWAAGLVELGFVEPGR